jgi:hypothetical protein
MLPIIILCVLLLISIIYCVRPGVIVINGGEESSDKLIAGAAHNPDYKSYYLDVEDLDNCYFIKLARERKMRKMSLVELRKNKYVDIMIMLGPYASFPPREFYSYKSYISNRLDSKILHHKVKLHSIINKKNIGIIPETKIISSDKRLDTLPSDDPWVFRVEKGLAGKGTYFISNDDELKNAFDERDKHFSNQSVLLSKHITDKMLLTIDNEQYSMQLRIRLIVVVDADGGKYMGVFKSGSQMGTSRVPYTKNYSDYSSQYSGPQGAFGCLFPDDYPGDADIAFSAVVDMFRKLAEYTLPLIKIYPESKAGFEIFNPDIIMTKDNEPRLIEINTGGSFPSETIPNTIYAEKPEIVDKVSESVFGGIMEFAIDPIYGGKRGDKYVVQCYP